MATSSTPSVSAEPADPLGALAPRLLALHEASAQLVALYDGRDVLRFANPAFRQAFDTAPDGHTTWADMMRSNQRSGRGSVVSASDFEAWLSSARSRRGKQPFRAFEADLCDGRWIWMTETVQAVEPGEHWMLCVASDITGLRQDGRALRQARDQALRAAQTDALTGLSNRRHLMQQVEQALVRDAERGWPLCMAVLDLDHFKQINDQLGHAAGDRVICDFACHLQASTRREDGCGRVGGEEFMLLLSGIELAQAAPIIERLLQRVRQARPLAEAPQRGYTSSVGLAQARAGETLAELFSRADAALYEAKRSGRDRMVCAD
nr:GGDEF domain-containing protein [uncultured Roseateles sp.]